MSQSARDAEAKAFEKFISTRKILIADASASARSGLFKIFQDLGAKNNQIILVNSFKQAEEQIAAVNPHIVVAEYDLGRSCGLDLMQRQRANNPNSKEMLFIVATGNTSQTAVARAAEEDIDAYILKPLTPESVRKIIMKAALMKIQPPPYVVTIEAGKRLLDDGDLDGAEAKFKEATGMDPAPSLAFYYLGQVKFLREILKQAKGSYGKGLEYNKIHYKCMVGLYELLMKEKDHAQAYEVVKKVSQYFPANPKRLAEVLRLAIVNAKYEDVEKYYQVFCNIDERDETLIRYICAALVVCGRHYLNTSNRARALELFTKASATGTGRVKVLKEVVQALIDNQMAKEARAFLEKFPPESMNQPEYLLLRFQITNLSNNLAAIMEEGRNLLNIGFSDENFYTVMLQRSLEAKLTMAAEQLHTEAIKKFPAKKQVFDEILKQGAEQKQQASA